MIQITDKHLCSGCHACMSICPKQCIEMKTDKEGFWYPSVDTDRCIDCGLCKKVCPILNKQTANSESETKAYAAMNINEDIRLQSSSGGIFTLLAEYVIDQGGAVFGAAFNTDFSEVEHICVENKEDLDKLRGSKYVQSRIGDTYKQAKEMLDSGRRVLFTGTPCQIGGLCAYLGKEYENLYTQDIICHGVPSPMVWRKYLEKRECSSASKTQRMLFRHKKYGWKAYSVLFEFSNNTEYVKKLSEDPYMKAFLSNICLRPSCYECSFKSIHRQADITLADFWGIENVSPDMDDDKGTSLILVHSKKGDSMLKDLCDRMVFKEVSTDVAEKYNSAAVHSVAYNKNRDIFISQITSRNFDRLVNKYCRQPLIIRLKIMVAETSIGKCLLLMKRKAKSSK